MSRHRKDAREFTLYRIGHATANRWYQLAALARVLGATALCAMQWLLAALTGFLAVGTLLPYSRRTEWWVRGADFPRIQFLLTGVGVLALLLLRTDFRGAYNCFLIATVISCIAQQLWWVCPYTPFVHPEVGRSGSGVGIPRLRMISANVLRSNRRRQEFLHTVQREDPDLLVTLETDSEWERELTPLEERMPHTLKCPLDNFYGMHFYSKWPFRDARIQFLVEEDIPSMHLLLEHPEGPEIVLHLLHPAPPSPTENETSSERDAELIMVGKAVRGSPHPLIVSGDLNDVAWSRTTRLFRKLSGLLDPRIGRRFLNTFHAHWWPMRWPVDHVFHSQHLKLAQLRRLPAGGSDHFPVLIELTIEPGGPLKKRLRADSQDCEQARETMAEEHVKPGQVHRPGE